MNSYMNYNPTAEGGTLNITVGKIHEDGPGKKGVERSLKGRIFNEIHIKLPLGTSYRGCCCDIDSDTDLEGTKLEFDDVNGKDLFSIFIPDIEIENPEDDEWWRIIQICPEEII